jgi:hypothetical protein
MNRTILVQTPMGRHALAAAGSGGAWGHPIAAWAVTYASVGEWS